MYKTTNNKKKWSLFFFVLFIISDILRIFLYSVNKRCFIRRHQYFSAFFLLLFSSIFSWYIVKYVFQLQIFFFFVFCLFFSSFSVSFLPSDFFRQIFYFFYIRYVLFQQNGEKSSTNKLVVCSQKFNTIWVFILDLEHFLSLFLASLSLSRFFSSPLLFLYLYKLLNIFSSLFFSH